MSLLNDITTAIGFRSPTAANGQQPLIGTGQPPGGPNAAEQVTSRFSTAFRSSFSTTMATVYERGAAGEFDDRTLALEEQAALQRLRQARLGAITPGPVATGGVPGEPSGIGGDGPGTVTGGGGTDMTIGGASAAPTAGVEEERALLGVRVRQGEARLKKISETLPSTYPLAAKLPSATTGFKPESFVPRSKDEAAAFAQRLVIDVTEAAARLDIVKTELDIARFELEQGTPGFTAARIAKLEADYERQNAYVAKLAEIVDRHSNGQVTETGTEVLAGQTARTAEDLPVNEIVTALKAEGYSDADIKRVLGAMELPVEEATTPGGSETLKSISSEMTKTLLTEFNRRVEKMQEESRKRDEARAEERRLEDKRATKKRIEKDHVERRADERRAQQEADFQRWLMKLEAQNAQRRAV